jgi:hypothetical protein
VEGTQYQFIRGYFDEARTLSGTLQYLLAPRQSLPLPRMALRLNFSLRICRDRFFASEISENMIARLPRTVDNESNEFFFNFIFGVLCDSRFFSLLDLGIFATLFSNAYLNHAAPSLQCNTVFFLAAWALSFPMEKSLYDNNSDCSTVLQSQLSR